MSYLFAAYLMIWVFLSGYVLHLTRKTNRLLDEIEILKNRLRDAEDVPSNRDSAH